MVQLEADSFPTSSPCSLPLLRTKSCYAAKADLQLLVQGIPLPQPPKHLKLQECSRAPCGICIIATCSNGMSHAVPSWSSWYVMYSEVRPGCSRDQHIAAKVKWQVSTLQGRDWPMVQVAENKERSCQPQSEQGFLPARRESASIRTSPLQRLWSLTVSRSVSRQTSCCEGS